MTADKNKAPKASNYSFSSTKSKKAWNFFWLNALSILAMLALFYLILYGDFLTSSFRATWTWLQKHPVLLALAASTPFFASLLVGRASSKRAKQKRLAAAKARADEEIAQARERRASRT